jgi:hypothetical protein
MDRTKPVGDLKMPRLSRGDRAVAWIEQYCIFPAGRDKGRYVVLTRLERETVHRIYDHLDDVPVDGPLAAYLALLHTAGFEALQRNFRPAVSADVFTVWNATGPDLRAVLKREGEGVVCPELGTRYPAAA